ncbi:MAG TPA: YraN family protein [Chromatiaceae bacterium]|nr:YraN family protein [Chromatiaceae bacterium]
MPPSAPETPRDRGADKERLARAYLEAQGLRLVASNYRCRRGEIDLVMRDARTLVFVEVRYRASERFGGAAASVGLAKQRRLQAAAGHFLQGHGNDLPCRFDVLAIGAGDRIDWIRDAFGAW